MRDYTTRAVDLEKREDCESTSVLSKIYCPWIISRKARRCIRTPEEISENSHYTKRWCEKFGETARTTR